MKESTRITQGQKTTKADKTASNGYNINPKNPIIRKFFYSNWNVIEHCDELQNIFSQKPLIGFRRLPNVKGILAKKKPNIISTDRDNKQN